MVRFTWQLLLALFALFVEGFRIRNKKLIADKTIGHPVEQVLVGGGGAGGSSLSGSSLSGSGYAVGAMGAVADAQDNTTFRNLLQPGSTNQAAHTLYGDFYLHQENGEVTTDYFWDDEAPANLEALKRQYLNPAKDIAEDVPALEADPRREVVAEEKKIADPKAPTETQDVDEEAAAKQKQAAKKKQATEEKTAKEKPLADAEAFDAVKIAADWETAAAAEATSKGLNAGGRAGSGNGPRRRRPRRSRLYIRTPMQAAGVFVGVGLGVTTLSAVLTKIVVGDLLKSCPRNLFLTGFERTHIECVGNYALRRFSPIFGSPHGGRPIYQKSNGRYLFFWASTGTWRIGIDITSNVYDLESLADWDAWCPTQATGWKGFHGDMWHPDIWHAMS